MYTDLLDFCFRGKLDRMGWKWSSTINNISWTWPFGWGNSLHTNWQNIHGFDFLKTRISSKRYGWLIDFLFETRKGQKWEMFIRMFIRLWIALQFFCAKILALSDSIVEPRTWVREGEETTSVRTGWGAYQVRVVYPLLRFLRPNDCLTTQQF